jgi:hypothetical protein
MNASEKAGGVRGHLQTPQSNYMEELLEDFRNNLR